MRVSITFATGDGMVSEVLKEISVVIGESLVDTVFRKAIGALEEADFQPVEVGPRWAKYRKGVVVAEVKVGEEEPARRIVS